MNYGAMVSGDSHKTVTKRKWQPQIESAIYRQAFYFLVPGGGLEPPQKLSSCGFYVPASSLGGSGGGTAAAHSLAISHTLVAGNNITREVQSSEKSSLYIGSNFGSGSDFADGHCVICPAAPDQCGLPV
jgi:hypothetical protein